MGKITLQIEVDERAAARAQAEGLDLVEVASAAVEAALSQSDSAKAARWAAENAEAIEAHKARIAEFGVFGEDLRTW